MENEEKTIFIKFRSKYKSKLIECYLVYLVVYFQLEVQMIRFVSSFVLHLLPLVFAGNYEKRKHLEGKLFHRLNHPRRLFKILTLRVGAYSD